ncbi:MAG TPA: CHC2 zinc finger domain-containing protein [Prolixibacteraceae bacterium]|nr:CHC2 zinc finger domain-containing protein [Prolixibacteraceae bacterium]
MIDAQKLIQQIKSAARIDEFIGKHIELKRTVHYKGICPFCNDNAGSFMVSPERGVYKCFDCGQGGDIISFIQKIENISFADAVMKVAKKIGIKVPDDLIQQSTLKPISNE